MRSLTRNVALMGAVLAVGASIGTAVAARFQDEHLGYEDTPILGKWHIHDGLRPQPKVIDPGTASTNDTPGRPPSDAVILFDGKDASHWKAGNGGPCPWNLQDGYLESVPKSGNISSKDDIGDCQLHIEWQEPVALPLHGQERGNSGVIFFGKYEIQVLDSYGDKTYPDGQAAAIYGSYPPLVNAMRKEGEWQVYDIIFTVPRWDADNKLVKPGYFTVLHNGVVVHNHAELLGETFHRQMPKYTPHPPRGPLVLQDHGNKVRYRNIWYRELKNYDEP